VSGQQHCGGVKLRKSHFYAINTTTPRKRIMPYKDQTSEDARRTKVEASTRYRTKNKEKVNAGIRELRKRKKQQLIEHLGGKCVGCGTTKDLQFDHIVRADKSFTIGQCMHKKMDELVVEANKCQLLCKTCHTLKGVCYNDHEQIAEGYRVSKVDRLGNKIIVTLEPSPKTKDNQIPGETQ
jgi:5-methylcytosine-specific restriction endonuclease McrA